MPLPFKRFNKPIIFLFITTLLIAAIHTLYSTPHIGGDTNAYLQYANSIKNGTLGFISKRNAIFITYLLYPSVLAITSLFTQTTQQLFHLATSIQALFVAISACYLYSTMRLLNINKTLSVLGGLFYGVNPDVLLWANYILTDSLNLSLLVIVNYYIVKALLATNTSKHTQYAITFSLILLFLSRPTNVAYILLSLIFLYIKSSSSTHKYNYKKIGFKLLVSSCLALFVIMIFLFATHRSGISYFQKFTGSMKHGIIIQGRHSYNIMLQQPWLNMSATQKVTFILHVILKRIAMFFALCVKGFSLKHTLLNYISLMPIITLSLLTSIVLLIKRKLTVPTLFLITVTLAYPIFFSLTILDFDFRYRITIIPFMIILSCTGINFALKQKRKTTT